MELTTSLTDNNDIKQIHSPNEETSFLEEYLGIFLHNARVVNSQEDNRILFYRGQSDKGYSLTPSVFRKNLISKEHTLINDMLLNSPEEFIGIDNVLERLIKMQHYGLPTRLLDITMNPLVALYFACNSNPDKDGEVLVFYDYIHRPAESDVRCLAALSEYTGSSERQLLGFLTERGISNPEIGKITSLTNVPIDAPLNNERIKRQHGTFLIVGMKSNESENPFQKSMFDLKPILIHDYEDGIRRSIIIPKDDKSNLLKELDALGINHGFLFPELEHQAAYIKDKYEEA